MTIWVNGTPIKSDAIRKRKIEIKHLEPCAYRDCRKPSTHKKEMSIQGETKLIPLCDQKHE